MSYRPIGKERDLQMFVFDTIRLYGVPNLIAYHAFNEGKRAQRSRGFYGRLGMKAGVPDVCLVLPGGRAAFLELKRASGRPSLEQLRFAAECVDNGALHKIVSTPEDAAATLAKWGALSMNPLRPAAALDKREAA